MNININIIKDNFRVYKKPNSGDKLLQITQENYRTIQKPRRYFYFYCPFDITQLLEYNVKINRLYADREKFKYYYILYTKDISMYQFMNTLQDLKYKENQYYVFKYNMAKRKKKNSNKNENQENTTHNDQIYDISDSDSQNNDSFSEDIIFQDENIDQKQEEDEIYLEEPNNNKNNNYNGENNEVSDGQQQEKEEQKQEAEEGDQEQSIFKTLKNDSSSHSLPQILSQKKETTDKKKFVLSQLQDLQEIKDINKEEIANIDQQIQSFKSQILQKEDQIQSQKLEWKILQQEYETITKKQAALYQNK